MESGCVAVGVNSGGGDGRPVVPVVVGGEGNKEGPPSKLRAGAGGKKPESNPCGLCLWRMRRMDVYAFTQQKKRRKKLVNVRWGGERKGGIVTGRFEHIQHNPLSLSSLPPIPFSLPLAPSPHPLLLPLPHSPPPVRSRSRSHHLRLPPSFPSSGVFRSRSGASGSGGPKLEFGANDVFVCIRPVWRCGCWCWC
jgi:hypothetical protein